MALDTHYGYLFKKELGGSVETEDRVIVSRYFEKAMTYNYVSSAANLPLYEVELIFNNNIGFSKDDIYIGSNYTTVYTALFVGIYKLCIQKDSGWASDSNSDFREYFSEINLTVPGAVIFVFTVDGVSRKYIIYTDIETFQNNYPGGENYYVFYDDIRERNVIEVNTSASNAYDDVFKTLEKLNAAMGANVYKGIYPYTYIGDTLKFNVATGSYDRSTITQRFYILYTRICPTKEMARIIISAQLIVDKGSRDKAAIEYPGFFEDEVRNIYPLRTNDGIPLSFNKLNEFIIDNPSFTNAEALVMLDYRCPLVVQNGISDVIVGYSPVEIENPTTADQKEANEFLFRLSATMNFLDGSNERPDFMDSESFDDSPLENYGYVAMKFSFVTWHIYKG